MTALYAKTMLGSSVYVLLWFFLAYSFLGVVIEGAFFLACERSLESRSGLLYLPLRPLYGVGGCGFALLLRPVLAQPVAVFVLGAALATVVEYLASLLTDRLFGAVSWDYRGRLLNLQGRVCLSYSLAWGALAVAALYLLDRPLRALLALVPPVRGQAVLTVLLLLVAASGLLTLGALARTRRRVAALRAPGTDPRRPGPDGLGTAGGPARPGPGADQQLSPDDPGRRARAAHRPAADLDQAARLRRTWRSVTTSSTNVTTWVAATTTTRAGSERS